MLPAEHAEWIEGVVAEALRMRAVHAGGGDRGAPLALGLLGPRALIARTGNDVRWEEYRLGDSAEGGEQRLRGHRSNVLAIVECEGRVCSGSLDGTIRVWDVATLRHERTLRCSGSDEERAASAVRALVAWEGRLISGPGDSKRRVWNVRTGACEQVVEAEDYGEPRVCADREW